LGLEEGTGERYSGGIAPHCAQQVFEEYLIRWEEFYYVIHEIVSGAAV